jgi:thiol peroxidase
MVKKDYLKFVIPAIVAFVFGCAGSKPNIIVEKNSAEPGNRVTFKGTGKELIGTPIRVGKRLPSSRVVDAETLQETDLSKIKGKVLFISIVPSIDTKVCEEQTHYLGEEGDKLPSNVMRITISRDLPFAQKRFAREARLEDVAYFSDYKSADFGKSTGLLVDDLMLLARSVIVVDSEGIVRYIQVVPEMTHLPDMETAFEKASELAR